MTEPKRTGRPKRHGYVGTPTYAQWAGMKQACDNPKATLYKYVGALGIAYVEAWANFDNFLRDMGEKPEGHTLQRRDRDASFSPTNCFWQPRVRKNEAV